MATPAASALAQELARLLDTHKAEDVVILDVSAQHGAFDCFVIATGNSSRHADTLAQEARAAVKGKGVEPWHLEHSSDWICGDFGDVVLHVFTPETRGYYDLEGLWADAEKISWTPAPALIPGESKDDLA